MINLARIPIVSLKLKKIFQCAVKHPGNIPLSLINQKIVGFAQNQFWPMTKLKF